MSSMEERTASESSNSDTDLTSSESTVQENDSTDSECSSSENAPRPRQVERMPQVLSDLEHHIYSDIELVYLLQERKLKGLCGSTASSKPKVIGGAIAIEELDAAVEMHPIHILRALGVNLNLTDREMLQTYYYFFSETRYTSNKATLTRNRSMVTSAGGSCWSQGGGITFILDKENVSLQVGVKRKFTFMHKSPNLEKKHEMVGSYVYNFQLHEFALAEDEKQEKDMISRKQTPLKFICMYRLIPVMQVQRKGQYLEMQSASQPRVDGLSSVPISAELLAENAVASGPIQTVSVVEDVAAHGSTEGGPNLATPVLGEAKLDLGVEPTDTRHDFFVARPVGARPEYDFASSFGELLAPNGPGTAQSAESSLGIRLAQVFVEVCNRDSNEICLVGPSEDPGSSTTAAGEELAVVVPQAFHKLHQQSQSESGSPSEQPIPLEHPRNPEHSLQNMSVQLALGTVEPSTTEVKSDLHNQNFATEPSQPISEATNNQEKLYLPEDWNSPQMIFIPGHSERFDRQWMGPFQKPY